MPEQKKNGRGVSGQGVSGPGVSALGGGCLVWGVSGPRGVSGLGGCLLLGGKVASEHALRQTHPPPVNRITDACKNITLAQLRCGR